MAPDSTRPILSPRAQFQSSIRKLSTDDLRRHRRNKSISLCYNPYELQHVSSLRVSPVRNPLRQTSPLSLGETNEEPDFGARERDVWSSKSPARETGNHAFSQLTGPNDIFSSPSNYKNLQNGLPPLPRPRFITRPDAGVRPRTRHGPSGPSTFQTVANKNDMTAEEQEEINRTAKFSEGTMNSRSGAVSSTWSDTDYATSGSEAEETESDATPKVSRKRRSGSFDLRDFHPPALTPSAIKRTLFGKREAKKEKKSESTTKPKRDDGEEAKKPKRRLRKSMSKLHFLGEKMKIFGSSAHDLPEQPSQKIAQVHGEENAILEERKRKAEMAYATQFGFKKQRDNNGAAKITSSPDLPQPEEFGGNQKFDSSTVRCRDSTKHSRRISTGSIQTISNTSRRGSINEHDLRKRPTRRELEKENQELRTLLRQSQVARDDAVLYTSASEVEHEPIPPVPPLRIRRSQYTPMSTEANDQGNFTVTHDENEAVPPIPPQHPDRHSVLGNISNSRMRRSRRESSVFVPMSDKTDTDVIVRNSLSLQNIPKLVATIPEEKAALTPQRSVPALPRSVSVIVEEPENEVQEKKRSLRSRNVALGKENQLLAGTRNEEWQWPEDVF